MRIRSLSLLSIVAASTLLLAGCGAGDSTDPVAEDASDECVLDAQPGAASDAVVVESEGDAITLTVPEGTAVDEIERTVLTEGTGEVPVLGDVLSVRYQLVDAATNQVLDSSERGTDGELPVLLDISQASLFVAALECEPLGSQIVMVLPGSAFGAGAADVALYAQATAQLPTVASGAAQSPIEGMPVVELDGEGRPSVTIPDGDAPAETVVEVLQKGDGPVVGVGDLVIVQYLGVKWSDGSEFDSSWSRGAPAQFATNQVVTGFSMALEGQTVGSQVLVVMPPSDGYGASAGHELQNESLVFVVDILGTTPMQ